MTFTARPFSSVLVANRGEIALRVIEIAQSRGMEAIAVYADPDAHMPFVRAADKVVRLGPALAAQSYLNIDAILEAARRTGAEAIHPGYGFLSENAHFARAVIEAGLVWIGPPPEAIEAMGDKARAKHLMADSDIPLLPGWEGEDQSVANLRAQADTIGYPLLIKAVAGGGGRGMRVVRASEEFEDALDSARREARSAFGDDTVLLEKFVERGRHVEIQVFADSHGHTVHFGERDCSAQRRRQKVIEEAPSPAITEKQRAVMGLDAVRAAEAVGYVGAGTVEFLLDEDGRYYFLEMNTRLQVEHPVTEEVTGEPLIWLQFDVAEGKPITVQQEEVYLRGHAIEVRLYAEDAKADFRPASGEVLDFDLSRPRYRERVDHGVEAGDVIGTDYDPMVAKFIAWGESRDHAIDRLRANLMARPLLGVTTNRDFLLRLLDSEAFRSGALTTGDLDQWLQSRSGPFAPEAAPNEALVLAALLMARLPGPGPRAASVRMFDLDLDLDCDGEAHDLTVSQTGPNAVSVSLPEGEHAAVFESADGAQIRWCLDGVTRTDRAVQSGDGSWWIAVGPRIAHIAERSPWSDGAQADPTRITAPVTGALVAVHVKPGDRVATGEVLAVMEAMKMEMRLTAEIDGVVAAVHGSVGAQAAGGSVVIELENEAEG